MGAATPAATAADPLAPLAAYQGMWRAESETLDSPYDKASRSPPIVLQNDCHRWEKFYACAQTVDGHPAALLVFSYTGAPGVYTSSPVPPDGSSARSGKLIIDGDEWTFPWEGTRDGAPVHFRVVNRFVSPDEIEVRREASTDGKTWLLIGRGHTMRVRGAVRIR
jgi:hypothetical protein